MTESDFIGRWAITEMETWDEDATALSGPPFIEFRPEGLGEFRFVAVHGFMDVRYSAGERARAEFSWDGDDDGTPTSGRGWAELVDSDRLSGRFFLHLGDDSSFDATRE